jgi:hypothetical protein
VKDQNGQDMMVNVTEPEHQLSHINMFGRSKAMRKQMATRYARDAGLHNTNGPAGNLGPVRDDLQNLRVVGAGAKDDWIETLREAGYQEWISAGNPPPRYQDCIGYKISLFYWGMPEIQNQEVANINVYWNFHAQLWKLLKGLPPNTRFRKITLKEDGRLEGFL